MRFRLDPLSPSGLSTDIEPQVVNRGGYAGSPDITRVLKPGINVTFTGNGTQQSPYVVNSSGGSSSDPFITDGTTGITKIRWQSTPGGLIYDMSVDDTGAVVTSLVNSTQGSPIGLLLGLTYP